MATPALRVEIWSDIACPWCYVGKRRFEAALAAFPQRDAVEIVWRSFELDTAAPPALQADGDASARHAARLAQKYGLTLAKAQGMLESMTATGAKEGLELRFDRLRAGNTFDAHRLLQLAARHGLQGPMKERLLRAYFTEGEAIDDTDTLVRLAREAGLPEDVTRELLGGAALGREVRKDEAKAQAIGVTGVPFFAIAGRYGVSGAQPAEVLVEVLTRAWAERETEGDGGDDAEAGQAEDPSAAACEGERCAP